MNEARYYDIISGKANDFGAVLLRLLFLPASWLYKCIVRARLFLYRIGVLRSKRVTTPVICVGNLSVGGTGKTPFVALVCERILAMKLKPVVVSRGYRSLDNGENDEARLLDELVPGVEQIQNPDRVAAAREAEARGADVIVLDDGFSHLRLVRDMDVLLFDGLRPFGYNALLPLGLLREPVRSARRAHLAVLTRADIAHPHILRRARHRLRHHGFPEESILHAEHMASALTRIDQGEEALSLSMLKDAPVALMSAIGNGEGFAGTVRRAGARIKEETHLADHFAYDRDWLSHHWPAIAASAIKNGAEYLIVTQKDAVKLRGRLNDSPLPVLELAVRMQVREGLEVLDEHLLSVIAKAQA